MTKKEEFKVSGDELLGKVKKLIQEGNVRRIIIKDKNGKSLMEFSLIVGVVGAVLAPVLAAAGAIAALVTECTITAERDIEYLDYISQKIIFLPFKPVKS